MGEEGCRGRQPANQRRLSDRGKGRWRSWTERREEKAPACVSREVSTTRVVNHRIPADEHTWLTYRPGEAGRCVLQASVRGSAARGCNRGHSSPGGCTELDLRGQRQRGLACVRNGQPTLRERKCTSYLGPAGLGPVPQRMEVPLKDRPVEGDGGEEERRTVRRWDEEKRR